MDVEKTLHRIANGEYQKDIAAEYGVSPPALHYKLKEYSEAHQQAREIGIERRLEDAEQAIDKAEDALNLARAREKFRAVSWRAEREFPHRWSARQIVEQNVRVSVDSTLQSSAGALLERVRGRIIDQSTAQTPQLINNEAAKEE